MPSPSADAPVLVVVAGPNGSGKSSFYRDSDLEALGRTVWIINPDLLAARIADVESMTLDAANVAAAERVEAWLEASIRSHQTVGVETVLSTPKYRRLVELAHVLRFQVWLVYVFLDSPDRNVARVEVRVQKGGHSVPEDKIRERYDRSMGQLSWFLANADRAWLYDNSGAAPKLVGEKLDGVVSIDDETIPVVRDAVRSAIG